MSNFIKTTKHPKTGKWEKAEWLDDYYGQHKYGVRFPDGFIYNASVTDLETEDEPVTQTEGEKELREKFYKMANERYWGACFECCDFEKMLEQTADFFLAEFKALEAKKEGEMKAYKEQHRRIAKLAEEALLKIRDDLLAATITK